MLAPVFIRVLCVRQRRSCRDGTTQLDAEVVLWFSPKPLITISSKPFSILSKEAGPWITHWFTRFTTRALSVIAGGALVCLPLAASAEDQPHANHAAPQQTAMSHQIAVMGGAAQGTDDRRGRHGWEPERSAMVEQQHQRIMDHLTQDPQVQQVNTGMYNYP